MTLRKFGMAMTLIGLTSPAMAQDTALIQHGGKEPPTTGIMTPPPAPVARTPRPTRPTRPSQPTPQTQQTPAQPLPPIAIGQTLNETVQADGRCTLDPASRFYQFRADANTRIEITLRSQSFDPVVEVGRVNGCEFQSLGRNDDGSGVNDGNNSRLTGTLVDGGTYVIRASAYGSRAMNGSYRLALRQLPALPTPATTARTLPLTVGRAVTGTLDSSDPVIETTNNERGGFIQSERGRPYRLYSFSGRAGQSYEFQLDSTDFDSFLEVGVVSPLGFATIDSNDDGPDSGRNSRLTVHFPSNGTVTLRVSPLSAASGSYTLTAVQR